MTEGPYKFIEVDPGQRARSFRVPRELVPSLNPPSWVEVLDKPATMPPSNHNHDDRYMTREESEASEERSSELADDCFNEVVQHHFFGG